MTDWFAVSCVLNGTRLPLTPDERKAVVRRLEHRLINHGEPPRLTDVTVERVAELLGCTTRTVERIKQSLPQADRLSCPICREDMWVLLEDGIVEAHPDTFYQRCPMSGEVFEADWEVELANTAVWLSQRLKAGDVLGVWEYLETVQTSHLRRVLVAALAGFSDEVDPFSWLKEAA